MPEPETTEQTTTTKITIRAFAIGFVLAGVFAWYTALRSNSKPHETVLSGTQLPILPYLMIMIAVLAINPLLRLLRIVRRLTAAELLTIFVMCMVSNGIANYGWSGHIAPIISALSNPDWNTAQSKWDIYVEPFVRDYMFIAAEGTQERAAKLRQTTEELKTARDVYRFSRDLEESGAQIARIDAEIEALSRQAESSETAEKIRTLKLQRRMLRYALEYAQTRWKEFEGRYDRAEVMRSYESRIKQLEAQQEAQQAELNAAKEDVFKEIKRFRKGLPDELRAIPGILPIPGEGLTGYSYRVKRLTHGRSALKALKQAEEMLGDSSPNAVLPQLQTAIDELEPVAAIPELEQRKQKLGAQIDALREKRSALEEDLRDLRKERRRAEPARFDELDAKIDDLDGRVEEIKDEYKGYEEEIAESIAPHLKVTERVATARQQLIELRDAAQVSDADKDAFATKLTDTMVLFPTFDATLGRFLIGQVKWSLWLRPLLLWGLIVVLTYVVMMSFNTLIFRQWAHHEKLTYPLAQLPMLMVDSGKEEDPIIPPMFKTGMFWSGFAIAFLILGWNFMAAKKIIPNIDGIPLDFPFAPYLRNSFLDPIQRARFSILFTVVGLSFLVPTRISFSMWFFFLFYLAQVLVFCWLGFGQNTLSFPMDSKLLLGFCNAEGGGALLVFAVVVLYKCRGYLLCVFQPKLLTGLDQNSRRELRIASGVFIGASLALIAGFTWILGANLFYSILFYFVCLVVTIGLTRVVTEGGILAVQADFNQFHVIRHTVGMDKTFTHPSLYSPLWIVHALLYFDLKSFIAPAMANALKIKDELRLSRIRFYVGIGAAILLALAVSAVTTILIAYTRGADSMRSWNYGAFGRSQTLGTIKSMVSEMPVDENAGKWWLLVGMLLMAFILLSRRKLFWMVHPIGLIMLMNPLTRGYWGSILIGWACKSLVSKYGSKETYWRIRNFFIGLIMGELLACLLTWTRIDHWWPY